MIGLYKKLPVWLQDWAITYQNTKVYAYKFGAKPFTRPIGKVVNEMKAEPFLLNDDKSGNRLQELLRYIKQHVPYYREHAEIYVPIRQEQDLPQWPLFQKNKLRKHAAELVSDEVTASNSVSFKTSGSTGAPLKGYFAIEDMNIRFKALLASMIAFGIDLNKPYARFPGHDIAPKGRPYRKDLLNQHLLFSIFHLSPKTAPQYHQALVKHQIEALEGYPSVLHNVARMFQQQGLETPKLKHILTTGEKLHPYQKDDLERIFGAKVFDYYGSSEGSIFAYTCTEGKLHCSNVTGLLEVLDKAGNPTPAGEAGRMIITSFTGKFFPLLRYDIGDRCIVSKEQTCACGTEGLILEEILGRDEDVFVTKDGRIFSRFSLALKHLPEDILASQLVLSNAKSRALVRYISPHLEPYQPEAFLPFITKIQSMIGESYAVEFEQVSEIRGARGKTPAVIIEDI
ncbi:MAG: AMP-binding protein [Bacteroidia bacterium]